MMRPVIALLLLSFLSVKASAEQFKTLGNWEVHYIVLSSTFLTPEVARQYGIQRSQYNAFINISVLDKTTKAAQKVVVAGSARNLLGTTKPLAFKEVTEGDAVYYLATLNHRDRETYRFDITVAVGDESQQLKFQQELHVDD